MKLENRVAIVTGMATGIGKGVALRLAADGAAVAGFDVQFGKAQQTAAEIVGLADSNPEDSERTMGVTQAKRHYMTLQDMLRRQSAA